MNISKEQFTKFNQWKLIFPPLSVSIYLFVHLSHSLCLSHFFFISISFSLYIYLLVCINVPLLVPPSIYLIFSFLSFTVDLSVPLFLCFYFSFSLCLPPCICLSVSLFNWRRREMLRNGPGECRKVVQGKTERGEWEQVLEDKKDRWGGLS